MQISNLGYIHEDKKEEDWVFGSHSRVPNIMLRPDRDWRGVLPIYEQQAPKFEPYSCVSEVTSNIEANIKKQRYEIESNDSARFLASITDTGARGGNGPNTIGEARRKKGNVSEELYATLDAETFEEYYKKIPKSVLQEARRRLSEWDFLHDYVPEDTPEALYDALKFSPLGVGVPPMKRDGDFWVPSYNRAKPTHYMTCVYVKNKDYFELEDTYPPFLKKVPWDFPFDAVKRYYVEKKEVQKTLGQNLKIDWSKIFKIWK